MDGTCPHCKRTCLLTDYCSICGELVLKPDSRRASVSTPNKKGDSNDSHSFRSGETSGAKSIVDETRDLLAFVRTSLQDEAPGIVEEFSDGVAICRLIMVIQTVVNPRFNAKPKLVLQKLNNVHSAVTAMESLGISTAGINTKDVVDGNEKQIMNILRGLYLYSRRAVSVRRLSFPVGAAARDVLAPANVSPSAVVSAEASSLDKSASPPGLAPSSHASVAFYAPVGAPVVATAAAKPATVERKVPVVRSAAATLAAYDALPDNARLQDEQRKHDEQLRSLDSKIALLNATLQTLDDAEAKAPPVITFVPVNERTATTTTTTGATTTSAGKPLKASSEIATKGRVVVVEGPRPSRSRAESSSTEGEEDSEDATATKQGKIEVASDMLKQWKQEEDEKKRSQAESAAVAEIRNVAAGGASPPPPIEDVGASAQKKKIRRRKKKGLRKHKGSSKNSSNASLGSAASDDEDSGISDSPDNSDDEPHSPALTAAVLRNKLTASSPTLPHATSVSSPALASGSSSPVVTPPPLPAKSDVVRERAATKAKLAGRKKRAQSRADRVNGVEQELDNVTSEASAIKAQASQHAQDQLNAVVSMAEASDTHNKWYVSPARQEELRSKLGSNAVLLKGLTRIQALQRGAAARKKRKLLQKRVYIAREVVESEKSYVRNLGLCIDYFYKPMSELSYISDIQLRQMFSEISVIRGFNAHLCGQLEQRHAKWQACGQRLGDIFLSFVAYFRSYTAYVNNYNDAMSLFYQLQAKNKSFQAFLQEKKIDPNLNGQELPAFLIMPIQRLPRYVMLLEDLLRNTPKDHADFSDLSTALAKVQEVADYVNEKKREAENINQVIDVQSRLTGMSKNLAEPHRRFVRQGSVINLEGKGETMLFLFNDILITGKESHGLGKLAEKGKEMLGLKKGSSTPKMNRKAAMSPFFGKKKPQLQAADDDREYKYQKTISLADCKVTAQFGVALPMGGDSSGSGGSGGAGGVSGVGGQLSFKTPLDTLNFGTATEEELHSWLHDLDSTAMRLVERKRLRCERTAKHGEGSDTFLQPTAGRAVVNKSEASFSGKVHLGNAETNSFEVKYVCLIKPHLYVFKDAEDDKPQGWLYLLHSHVVLGSEAESPAGFSFRLHVPHGTGSNMLSASPWLTKHSRRVKGHAGNPSSSVATDKEVMSEEDQDRDVYEFVGGSVNESLSWCREIRNVILDAVKLPDDLCPLDIIQRNTTEENHTCADCGAIPSTFASINLGVFLCEGCKDLHEELLEGVSTVRDIKEPWDITPQQRFELESLMGNIKRNKIFEKNASRKDVPRPRPNDTRESRARWIKAKYVVSGLGGSDSMGSMMGASSTPSMRRMSVNSKDQLKNKE